MTNDCRWNVGNTEDYIQHQKSDGCHDDLVLFLMIFRVLSTSGTFVRNMIRYLQILFDPAQEH